MITQQNQTQPLRPVPSEHANDSTGVHRFLDGKPLEERDWSKDEQAAREAIKRDLEMVIYKETYYKDSEQVKS